MITKPRIEIFSTDQFHANQFLKNIGIRRNLRNYDTQFGQHSGLTTRKKRYYHAEL